MNKKGGISTAYLVIFVIILFWIGLSGWIREAGQESSFAVGDESPVWRFFVENLNFWIFIMIVIMGLAVTYIAFGGG